MRTTLWRYHLGGGCVLALAYVYLPYPALRMGALVVLCLATLASIRLWRPSRPRPFKLFATGEAVGFVAGSLGSSAAVTRAGGSVAAAALTMVAYLIGIGGYAMLIRSRSPGRDRGQPDRRHRDLDRGRHAGLGVPGLAVLGRRLAANG